MEELWGELGRGSMSGTHTYFSSAMCVLVPWGPGVRVKYRHY